MILAFALAACDKSRDDSSVLAQASNAGQGDNGLSSSGMLNIGRFTISRPTTNDRSVLLLDSGTGATWLLVQRGGTDEAPILYWKPVGKVDQPAGAGPTVLVAPPPLMENPGTAK